MKKIFVSIVCLCLAVSAAAQVRLSAQTDKTDLALDDELTLTVQVSGISGNIVMPQLPSLPAFNVYSRQTAQSTVNGHTTLSFKYLMIPRFVGRTTIGPITFNYGGKKYQTEPIDIRIYKSAVPAGAANRASRPAAQKSNQPTDTALTQLPPLEKELATRAYAHENETYFIVSAVSNKHPYVGETFTLGVRFYYAQGFYEAAYENPTVSNLFMQDKGRTQGRQTINGTVYNYEEKLYELSAVSAGKATVGAASVQYRTSTAGDSLFDRFFGGAVVSKPVTVSSKPIALSARALPPGQPASFYGAVGSGFTLTAQLDKPETEAGEAVTLSVTIQGPGSLKTSADLKFTDIPGFSSYPAAPETGEKSSRSYKIFKTVLVPNVSGTYTLDPISWSYFDPAAQTYKTLTSRALSLRVLPSSHADKQLDFGTAAVTGNGVQTLRTDIRYVKNTADYQPGLLHRLATWNGLHALAFLWLAVCLFIACIGKKTAAKKHAYQTAKSRLKKAHTYEDISDALSGYLLDKWHISTASLPLKDILSALERHQVSEADRQAFSSLWKELESARFAPAAGTEQQMTVFVARAAGLLKTWEKQL